MNVNGELTVMCCGSGCTSAVPIMRATCRENREEDDAPLQGDKEGADPSDATVTFHAADSLRT